MTAGFTDAAGSGFIEKIEIEKTQYGCIELPFTGEESLIAADKALQGFSCGVFACGLFLAHDVLRFMVDCEIHHIYRQEAESIQKAWRIMGR